MTDIIRLHSFKMIRLNLEQNPYERPVAPKPSGQETGYKILTRPDDPNLFLMLLGVKGMAPLKEGPLLGLSYDVMGAAEFQVPGHLTPEQKHAAVALNGGAILYGLIRGQFSVVSGSFQSGSVLLPTLNWQEIVRDIEKKNMETPAKQGPASPADKQGESSHPTEPVSPKPSRHALQTRTEERRKPARRKPVARKFTK